MYKDAVGRVWYANELRLCKRTSSALVKRTRKQATCMLAGSLLFTRLYRQDRTNDQNCTLSSKYSPIQIAAKLAAWWRHIACLVVCVLCDWSIRGSLTGLHCGWTSHDCLSNNCARQDFHKQSKGHGDSCHKSFHTLNALWGALQNHAVLNKFENKKIS